MVKSLTFIEIVVAVVILVVILGLVASIFSSAPQETGFFVLSSEMSQQSNLAASRLQAFMRFAIADSLTIAVEGDTTTIEFKKLLIDPGTGLASVSGTRVAGFNYNEDGDNGTDDDGDGITDDGVIYLIGDDGVQAILVANVLEGSFTAQVIDDVMLRIQFQVAARWARGATFTGTATDSVYSSQDGYVVVTESLFVSLRN